MGRVQLIDGSKLSRQMRNGLGSKRNELGPDDIATIVQRYGDGVEAEGSKLFRTEDFLYRTITVERPLRLSFTATLEHIDAVFAQKPVLKLAPEAQQRLRACPRGRSAGRDGIPRR